ncbi:uncharacterized protein [Arachis hypogaea]|uniref:uncharacterized protein n=1 Tax=Arachis hypogaea TaxID=3818 RepID=UPI000DED2534|nr:uncharacterized protein LOC112721386 [Arachis hypogaea]
MCVDYTDLNKAFPKDAFPLPNIDGLVDVASGHRYLSFMDAYSGYNQIPMQRPDEEKTAFITPDGTYCYTVMPFGLKNAGATYQRLVNKIFQNLSGTKLEVYIDDMLAKTDSGEQLISDLKVIMNTLRKHKMPLNPTKCAFGMEAGKFLGFMITQRGVEANPEKCRAVLEMTSPKNINDIQKLTGRLTALSRFLGASAQKAIPFFRVMKKGTLFKWEAECEKAFQHFKKVLAEPPVLAKPQTGETLYLYLSITEEALAAALIRENEKKEQKPIYFISKVLQDTETRYSHLEKLAFALLTASRRLRQYFQAHPVTVRTDQAVKQVLQKPDLAGRMLAWSIELSQFDIKFEPRYAIKAQAMTDFIAEMTLGNSTPESWKLHVDGTSNVTSGGAGVILESQNGVVIEQSVRYEFPVSNNQAEYEALLAGLALAKEVGAKVLEINTDSQVVSSQINGDYQTRDPLLQQYVAKVNKLKEEFNHVTIRHVPKKRNARADLLSKLASTKPGHGNKSLIQEVVKSPSISTMANAYLTLSHQGSSTYPILQYLLKGTLPEDPKEEKQTKREAANYTVVAGQLYKREFSQPLLKCVETGDTEYILRKIHKGCCDHHVGATGKTPFRLTYGTEAVIPVKIGDPSPRRTIGGNDKEAERDLIDEVRSIAHLRELALKQRISLRYNNGVIRREFATSDLVLRQNDIGPLTPGEGKLTSNWEGPYRIKAAIGKGAYKLERLNGDEVPRTWNAANLRCYYT